MVSLHREKKLAIRRGIDPDKVNKCESNAELSKFLLQDIKKKSKNNDNKKENNES